MSPKLKSLFFPALLAFVSQTASANQTTTGIAARQEWIAPDAVAVVDLARPRALLDQLAGNQLASILNANRDTLVRQDMVKKDHTQEDSEAEKVKDARLMREYVGLLRTHALGSFRSLLEGISRDPAMFLWLGAEANRKARPNKNLARAIIENFTLGPDTCTESDIREASRAFTGWFVLRSKLRYIDREHDDGGEQILGQQGNFSGEDALRIILEHPAPSRRLTLKLYRWLIDEVEQPHDALILPLAESFAADYDVSRLVETMLRSNLFFSDAAYRRRIKCPVEFAAGIVKALDGMVSTTELAKDTAALGRNLYHPPTVNGWAGGIGGFDNHANQLGNHCALLHQLSESLTAFAHDLKRDRLLDKVLLMTISEFGRTVKENGRRGTGHGAAAPILMVGGRLKNRLVGTHPILTDLDQDALKFHTDFRRIYATVLEKWLGFGSRKVLNEEYQPLDILDV